jgi:hypothetical protein
MILTFLSVSPEAARLALIGFSLISVALVLRSIFFPHPARLDSSAAKVEIPTK